MLVKQLSLHSVLFHKTIKLNLKLQTKKRMTSAIPALTWKLNYPRINKALIISEAIFGFSFNRRVE